MQKFSVYLALIISSISQIFAQPDSIMVSPLPDEILVITPTVSPTPTFALLPSITITILPTSKTKPSPIAEITIKTTKDSYTIAMLGDSMTDQLGDKFDYILPVLTKKYPQTDFLLFNYGIGATDVVSGLNRLTVKTTRHEKELIPLLTLKPDIIILESFAYNHWTGSEKDLDQYRNTLQAIIDKIREEKIDLIGLRTIAPNSNVITDGIPNIQLTKEEKKEKSALIKKYLELFEQIVKKNNLPLVDTYTKSLDITGNGKLLYISKTDHLHPSADGLKLISEGILKDLEKVIVASASSIY